jgi:gamma-glutamyl-gamma-aminobutyrate hydrolase PuuD
MMMPQLAPTLRPFAIAEDQTMEGVYHPELPIAGVMWHPERWDSPTQLDKILSDAFIYKQLFWK